MKKLSAVLLSLSLVLCFSIAFGGCGEKEFNDSLPSKKALVKIDYSDGLNKKAGLTIENETEKFSVSGCDFYNKKSKKRVNNLFGGDRLEIYYGDESFKEIDHIYVEKAEVLVVELKSSFVDGNINEGKRLYTDKQGVFINNTEYRAYWVMDRTGNYIDLDDIDDATKIYGTYIEEEDLITGYTPYITKVHYLHALYLYNPKYEINIWS